MIAGSKRLYILLPGFEVEGKLLGVRVRSYRKLANRVEHRNGVLVTTRSHIHPVTTQPQLRMHTECFHLFMWLKSPRKRSSNEAPVFGQRKFWRVKSRKNISVLQTS
jgi:hypothetical protein